ncbi:MAG: type II secretion system protein GspG [Luteolibacter sp.]
MKNNPLIHRRAFTLVEMLVTISIIAILAGLSLGIFGFAAKKQDNSKAAIQIKLLEQGIEEYKLDNGDFPDDGVDNKSLYQALYWDGFDTGGKVYISQLEPENDTQGWVEGSGTGATIVDPWGEEYQYTAPGTNNPDFDLMSKGPDLTADTEDDITNY